MRLITTHHVGDVNSSVRVEARGETGPGGACGHYVVALPPEADSGAVDLLFATQGSPGVTNEVLLAVVIDRLQGFQSGPFACRENAIALTKLQEGLMWLQHRTRERMARGVEGSLVR